MRLRSPWVARLLDTPGSPAERLVGALSEDILEHRLEAGDRLPAHRDLAHRLGIGLGTVTKAYGALERRGLVRSVNGRGTFVALVESRHGPVIDLSRNAPPASMSERVLARTLTAMAKRLDAGLFNGYPPVGGHEEHRRLLATWFAGFGMEADPRRLVLTSGAHHAVTIAMAVLCAGGTLFTEAQTYPGVIALARHMNTEIVGLRMDEEGILPDALDRALTDRGSKSAALYVTPTMQNPTTATMSNDRRAAVVAVCRKHALPIIEDDVYTLAIDEGSVPLAMMAPELTFYANSLSKTLNPSLRIGGLVAPDAWFDAVCSSLQVTSVMVSPLSAAVMEQWLLDGTAQELIQSIHRESVRRHQIAERILGSCIQKATRPGYHLWLPMSADKAAAVEAAANAKRVLVTPPASTAANTDEAAGIRLCFGAPPIAELEEALELVAELVGAGPGGKE